MWLRNYYNCLTGALLTDDTLTSSTPPTDYNPPIMAKNTSAQSFSPYYQFLSNAISSSTYSEYGYALAILYIGKERCKYGTADITNPVGIWCGTGTTPVTYEDYTLESPINSGLTIVSNSGTLRQQTQYNSSNNHYSTKRSFTINNSSTSNITISEIGISVCVPYQSTYAISYYGVLVYREVLDTPITLAPSESIVVTFEKDAEIYNYTPYPSA